MAKKSNPVITYKEILCLAISNLEGQIDHYRAKSAGLPADHEIHATIQALIEPLEKKQEVLKQMYEFECGVAYI